MLVYPCESFVTKSFVNETSGSGRTVLRFTQGGLPWCQVALGRTGLLGGVGREKALPAAQNGQKQTNKCRSNGQTNKAFQTLD